MGLGNIVCCLSLRFLMRAISAKVFNLFCINHKSYALLPLTGIDIEDVVNINKILVANLNLNLGVKSSRDNEEGLRRD